MTRDPAGSSGDVHDLVVIGGGVMGLFTAYTAARQNARVIVLERGRVGDPATASYGRTRSYRRDYLDAGYARLADESIRLWTEFEARAGREVLVRCGCMNIARACVTPDLDATYAAMSTRTLRRLGLPVSSLDAAELSRRYPDLRADRADLDQAGGLVNLPAVTQALVDGMRETGSPIVEEVQVVEISREGDDRRADRDAAAGARGGGDPGVGGRAGGTIRVRTARGDVRARSLVITAGHGTNDVLALLPGPLLRIPITRDRPSEARYLTPPAAIRHRFTSDAMPVVAYLDTGIYLHPIVEGLTDAVKIGYYHPPDLPHGTGDGSPIDGIAAFLDACLPGLSEPAGSTITDVTDVDRCDYDLVADDDFVLGAVPGQDNVFVGVGWRGTGYKFAPWVGRVLFELACREGTVYDIGRFDPARFAARPGIRSSTVPATGAVPTGNPAHTEQVLRGEQP